MSAGCKNPDTSFGTLAHRYAQIVIDAVISNDDKIFDYEIPIGISQGSEAQAKGSLNALSVQPGMRVLVPFGPKNVEGFVLGTSDTTDVPRDKIKPITKILEDFIAVKPEFITILDDICNRFKLRKIDVLRLFVPGMIRGRKRKRIPQNRTIKTVTVDEKKITLTAEQRSVIDEILKYSADSSSNIFVLHGVTGSGKTEVYMNIIGSVLSKGKTAICLVPEIGLTPQVFANFRARFGETVAILHSGLSPTERYDEWLRLHSGEARIAVGARSAIFAPLENIGVIIIDEEHDGSYQSESNPRFQTQEIAKLRCAYNNCALILGSATPSIETYHAAAAGQYKLLRLEKRVGNLQMPGIELVDMAAELRSGNAGVFSRAFIDRLRQTIAEGNQAMIFLNRRGFSSFIMCKNCGWVARCENCDVSLVYHKEDNLLKCHYCALRFTPVSRCPKCDSIYLKHGATGTQKIVEELENLFTGITDGKVNPTAVPPPKIFRMDADNTKTKDALVGILDEFASTKPAILVGTQMIAKGHHFPNVTLVGIIDADNSLHFSDYRSAERTFALITQVAGRAGRTETGAKACVMLQTYMPGHYVYRLAQNYDYQKFFDKEINTRQLTKYPPFSVIARILVTGERDDLIKLTLQKIMTALRTRERDFIYLSAMKSPLGRLQNKFRYQILMRFARSCEKELLDFIAGIVKMEQPKNMQIFLEINPQSLS